MSPTALIFVLLALSSIAYYFGRRRAFAVAGGVGITRDLHSRPTYYGALTALWCGLPALMIFSFWLAFESKVITSLVVSGLPENIRTLPPDRLTLVVNDLLNMVSGNIVSGQVNPAMQEAADHYHRLNTISHAALTVFSISIAIAFTIFVRIKIPPDYVPATT